MRASPLRALAGALAVASSIALAACGGGRPAAEPSRGGGIVVVTAGTILTMNEAEPTAPAFVVGDGRVLATGAPDDLRRAYPMAGVLDLGDAVVVPGFVDSHVHARELGEGALRADLDGVTSVAEMVARLRRFYPAPKPGEWLSGKGWDEGAWASEGYPDRRALDEAFPGNPVVLASRHGFATFVNGEALRRAGIDGKTEDPQGGAILHRPDGAPTGVLLTLAQALVNVHVPAPDVAATRRAIESGLGRLRDAGVTSVHEAGMKRIDVTAFEELAREHRLPLRVYGMLDGNDDALVDAWLAKGPRIDPEGWLTVRTFKVFYDGSLGSRTALLREPYADEPAAARPSERISPERLERLATRAAAAGFQLAVHAIGDEAIDRVLAIYERVLAGKDPKTFRFRIEHAQVLRPDLYERFARLGVIASVQPSHAVGDGPWAGARLGPSRLQHAYAYRTLLRAGVPLVINSDLPGEPWLPMQTLYFAVTRRDLAGQPPAGFQPEQTLTVEETLRAMTATGAFAAFQEKLFGSLRAGAQADFVALSADPRATPKSRLATVEVRGVWIGGRKVAGPR